ncbi:MAG: endonuclease/exonuclease/phosphatase family protein [Clostridia bacterium]|nr:endonuclease/exonuclease/phosphatase family protein [Clostridia bacterium]
MEEKILKIISYNVDGLPLPKFMCSTGRDPKKATEFNAKYLNDSEADIIALQEDFGYHKILKEKISYEYKTIHSGSIPFGDGLSVFSRYPIFNVKRVEWCEANGILRDASDELTPKGFLYCAVEVMKGVYIDVYDLHADAAEADDDVRVRIKQFNQLLSFIESNSKDRAVIVLGDTNTRIGWENSKLRELFVEKHGFKDCWTECCLGGRYQKDMVKLDEYQPFEPDGWDNKFDSLDKVMFRNGKAVSFEALTHDYVKYGTEEEKKVCAELSDHSAAVVTVRMTVDRDALPGDNRVYNTETVNYARKYARRFCKFFKALGLIASDIPSLLKGGKIETK